MTEPQSEARRIRAVDAAFALIVFAAIVNFAHYAIQGDFGLFALMEVESDQDALSRELEALRAERASLEGLTRGLDPATLDLDLLDERARAALGLMRPDEIRLR